MSSPLQELRSPSRGPGERDRTFRSFISILSVSAGYLRKRSNWRTHGSQKYLLLPQMISTDYRSTVADHIRRSCLKSCSIPWLPQFRWRKRLLESQALKKKKRKKPHKIASGELLYSTGSSARCPVMTDTVDSRWAWRLRKRICVSLQLMHIAEQKQMQHCKAILLQLKFLKRNKWKMKKKHKNKGKKNPIFYAWG